MRQCPKCDRWSLDFDDYFGRFRCFSTDCSWIQPTATERRLRLLGEHKCPKPLGSVRVPELDLTIEAAYDDVNDVLVFDFNDEEGATFDFPDSDPRIIWSVGRQTGQVHGCVIVGAAEFGVSEVLLRIAANIEKVEQGIVRSPITLEQGKPTRLAIENVAVTLRTSPKSTKTTGPLPEGLLDILKQFREEYMAA